ncbi:MAG: DUF1653 domain-containing protein [Butyrivibrio sp.]|nr:DUF1653 domain-containing protein [Butyrivibrio sp.]
MERPRPQELYRHFKGNLYQIITIAVHSETREEMVVYQALYGDYKVYVRPLDMFMSKVDRVKYPDVKQEYRFEKVNATKQEQSFDKPVVNNKSCDDVFKKTDEKEDKSDRFKDERDSFRKNPYEHSEIMDKSVDEEAKELNLDPLVIKFLDADLASERNDILSKLRPTITNDMIDVMAMSLGVVVPEGDVYDRFDDLRTCLNTMEKFESTRLRS